MMTSLTPLSPLALLLSWVAEPGLTYTIQTSPDLGAWSPLPYVISGRGLQEEVAIGTGSGLVFVRLRSSADGDTNGNSLPDRWELDTFGYLDVDAGADPDNDRRSTFAEWLAGTDPLDPFNGERPVLHIACGRVWLVPAGQLSPQALCLVLFHADGRPWADAPVDLLAVGGDAGLHSDGSPEAGGAESLTVFTDQLGRIHPAVAAVRVMAPAQPGARASVRIRAGGEQAELLVQATGADHGPPPRQLQRLSYMDGTRVYSWSGGPGAATAVVIEEQDQQSRWIQVAEVAVADLGQPDPGSGRYTLAVN